MAHAIKSAHLGAMGYAQTQKISLPIGSKIASGLLATVSAAVLSVSMASMAGAQALPAECAPNPALTGGTILCTASAPGEIDGIATTVDDLSVTIGDGATPTAVNEAAGDGINMSGGGAQTLNIVNSGSSVTGSANGVQIDVTGGVDDLTIVSEGSIAGGGSGIVIENAGTGAVSITTADVNGSSGAGISASSSGGGVTVDSSAGSVSSGVTAIVASATDAGNIDIRADVVTGGITGIDSDAVDGDTTITLSSTAVVSGMAGIGIDAQATGTGAIILQGNSGDVIGGTDGFYTRSMGGDIAVNMIDSITGQAGDGIDAASIGGDIMITDIGTILGTGGNGIVADAGTGDISIQAVGLTGGVTGTGSGDSIVFVTSEGVEFESTEGSGIFAVTDGAINIGGTATIGDVTSINGIGILAQSTDGGVTVNSSAGTVMGGRDGLLVIDTGAGAVSITTADVNGSSGAGISASSSGGGVTVDSSAGSVSGGIAAIVASTTGTGNIDIRADVVTGGITGIDSDAVDGDTTITLSSTAVVSGMAGIGIDAQATGTGAIILQGNSGDVIGGTDGIRAQARGSISITANKVAGMSNAGIVAENLSSTPSGDISIASTGNIVGANLGIKVENSGTGNVNIAVNNVENTTPVVGNYDSGTSNNAAISVRSSGDTNINSTGDVIGGEFGILARHSTSGGLNITANNVSSSGHGILLAAIRATNFSSGTDGLAITTTGDVIGASRGISAQNGSGDLSITVNNVTGLNSSAISASNGGGSTSIVTTGTIIGNPNGYGFSGNGIFIFQRSTSGGSITINSQGDVSGFVNGISATQTDQGAVNITNTANVMGRNNGISAQNEGSNALTINVNNVSSGIYDGIVAINGVGSGLYSAYGLPGPIAGGSDLSISATGMVSGQEDGVDATNLGTGQTTINVTDVTGKTANGVRVENGMNTAGLSITASGEIVGATNGITAVHRGNGGLSVTTSDVTGTMDTGIMAVGGVTGGDVMITTGGDVTGGTTGIMADAGTGGLTLNLTGDVTGDDNGILATTQSGTNLTIAAGHIISGGAVGISTMATGGSSASNDVLNILGTINGAVTTFEGDDLITLADGSAVNGVVMLGEGADGITLNGGSFTTLSGGDGVDSIDFNAADTAVNGSGGTTDMITEFEAYNFNAAGATLMGTNTGLTSTNFNAAGAMLMGSLSSSDVLIAAAADLQVADGTMITGNLSNMGALGINMGGVGTLAIDGNFVQSATGNLTLDAIDVTNFDAITVTGDVALDGALNINLLGTIGETITLIDGGADLTGDFAELNGLQNGLLMTHAIVIDLENSNVDLVVSAANRIFFDRLTPNQAAAADTLATDFDAGTLTGGLRDLVIGLGQTPDAVTLSTLLDELTPEIVNAGVDGVRLAQGRFRQTLMSQYQFSDGSPGEVAALGALASAAATRAKAQSNGPQIWGAVNYNYQRNDTTTNNKGYRADGFELAAGISGIALGDWQVGFATGYSDFDTNDLRGVRDAAASELFRFGVHGSAEFGAGALGINGHVDIALDYGSGNNDITMFTAGALPALGTAQSGSADTETYGMSFRLNLDGSGDKKWPVRPFVSIGYDHFSQDAVNLTGGGVTDLAIEKIDLDRITFGYGIRGDQTWGKTLLRLGVAGYHYEGDTQTSVTSRFLASGLGGTPFTTVGFDIKDQFQVDAGISQQLGSGWSLSLDGYAEFGDIEAYGGIFKIGKKF